jgi:hypothetical protein
MMKQAVLMSAFALTIAASPSEAQQPQETCKWNDVECIRGQESRREPEAQSCRWNDVECLKRTRDREQASAERRPNGDYDRGDDRSGRADARCVERKRNGECALWERKRDDRDGRDRDDREYGAFPRMASALALRNGRGVPADARRWLGNGPFRVELVNRDRDAVPEMAVIHSRRSNEKQIWYDRNNDGRADRIVLYRNGRVVRDVK